MNKSRWLVPVVATLVVSLANGCSTGVIHTVRTGENLYRIGKAYGVPYLQLGKVNGLDKPFTLQPGDRVFVPEAARVLPVGVITPRSVRSSPPRTVRPRPARKTPVTRTTVKSSGNVQAAARKKERAPTETAAVKKPSTAPGLFGWPTEGKLMSSFGPRGASHHDGIDIAGEAGSAVIAARAGKVIFSDQLPGYGWMIILEHDRGFSTLYAHNDRNRVAVRDQVSRGQRIADLGSSGRTAKPHLHFEIRRRNVVRDPMYYLSEPGQQRLAGSSD
ncbi:MAG: M23 family metallopeptidase [Proteobacteria bacterium]|nr:M23 family metallopeptidase [Pseudomonadota bacterium]